MRRRSFLSAPPLSSSSLSGVSSSWCALRFCSMPSSPPPLPPAGTCVAHHCRPTPVSLNLDELSRELLGRSWPQTQSYSGGGYSSVPSNGESKTSSLQSDDVLVTINNVRRIMPPNPTVAAMVGATPPSFHPTKTGAGSRKYEHSAENLLLLRAVVGAENTSSSSSSNTPPVVRDLVVFPDATLVVWGEGCAESDAFFFARLLFGDATSSSSSSRALQQKQKQKNVEIEFIQYRYVDTAADTAQNKEEEDEVAEVKTEETVKSVADDSASASSRPAAAAAATSAIEIIDGVATICAPSSPSMHLNLCYPTEYHSADDGASPSPSPSSSSSNDSTTTATTTAAAAAVTEFDYTLEMLPVVMAIAQSTRVDAIDNFIVSRVARDVRTWQRHLAFRGRATQLFLSPASTSLRQSFRSVFLHVKSRPTLNQLRRCKAKLLGVMDEVTFALELEATPKLLRIATELQRFRTSYDNVADHFELEERLEALESRIEALNESLAYLHEERHSMLTENLTIVILVLIFLELVVGVYH